MVAALEECEERDDGLVASIDSAADSRLAATIAALKREIKFRRDLEAELLTAVESERQRIGQDLHDDLCQRLGATALMVGSLANQIEVLDKNLSEKVRSIAPLMAETIENCRNLARGLNPITLTSAGLPAALAELADRVPDEVKFEWPHSERIDFKPAVALHLYRIAEEAVANAVKHANAKRITIKLAVLTVTRFFKLTMMVKESVKRLQATLWVCAICNTEQTQSEPPWRSKAVGTEALQFAVFCRWVKSVSVV